MANLHQRPDAISRKKSYYAGILDIKTMQIKKKWLGFNKNRDYIFELIDN